MNSKTKLDGLRTPDLEDEIEHDDGEPGADGGLAGVGQRDATSHGDFTLRSGPLG